MAGVGDYDRLIAFHAATLAEDALGVETETFGSTPAAQSWAKVLFGTGQERRDGAAAGAVQTATFRVTAMDAAVRGITTRDIIRFDGADWGISSIAPVGPQGAELEFAATRRSADNG